MTKKNRRKNKKAPSSPPARPAIVSPVQIVGGQPSNSPPAKVNETSQEPLQPAIVPSADLSPLLVTRAQLSRILSLSPSSIDRAAKSGSLPGRVVIGRQVRYHLGTVDAWLLTQIKPS